MAGTPVAALGHKSGRCRRAAASWTAALPLRGPTRRPQPVSGLHGPAGHPPRPRARDPASGALRARGRVFSKNGLAQQRRGPRPRLPPIPLRTPLPPTTPAVRAPACLGEAAGAPGPVSTAVAGGGTWVTPLSVVTPFPPVSTPFTRQVKSAAPGSLPMDSPTSQSAHGWRLARCLSQWPLHTFQSQVKATEDRSSGQRLGVAEMLPLARAS